MSALTDKYSKNFSPEKKKEFEKRVRELAGQMSEESAIDLVLKELFDEKFYSGGRVGFQMGGIFSADPDKAVKFNLDGEIINLNPEFFNKKNKNRFDSREIILFFMVDGKLILRIYVALV